MAFTNFINGEPAGNPYLHMNFDKGFSWDTKVSLNRDFKIMIITSIKAKLRNGTTDEH